MRARLDGKSILVTRAAEDNPAWSEAIRALGGDPVEFPCLRCEVLRDEATAERLTAALRETDWLALTSRRGVEAVSALHPDPIPARVRVAAVGEATAEAARDRLGRCDLVAPDGTGEGLARELLRAIRGNGGQAEATRIVAAAAREGAAHLEDVLSPEGVIVARVAVYRTISAPPVDRPRDLSELGLYAVLLASPSAVRGLMNQARVPSQAKIVTIGPATSKSAREAGLEVAAQARHPNLEALLEAIP